ncbi:serine hydrolase domain-containing protein [Pseudobutyrivibrio xylanivorans]|uniref:CubicO group peptidase, beta-lactamase class C family n=1 Tax=Pseudobutyrivibrio xylanivorans TaxID=185007 RepID=A0A1G5S237_PSEXY|nr:serine hydrolase [Pseudobutyrivibrio xylanivorans]SCZ79900.1 CubicO group peptidase, beta-lactamase class C family [Pseudobutyrivibrio xylanivorans]
MNKEELHQFISESKGNESNICQICVIRGEEIVYEDCWRGFKPEDAVNVNSVTKGVMAILAGIAVDKGAIKSLDEKVLAYFPDYQVKRGEKTIYDVTIRHLLTMTAPYKGKSEPWKKVCTSDDWTVAILDFLGGRKGITGEFRYSTLGIQILAGIIERATGEKLIDFANKNLFLPLGIPEHVIHGDSSKEDQFDFFMNKGPRKNEWYSDPQDTVTAGWGLCATGRDLAKLGSMVLNEGKYNGQKIVSSEWIKQMTTPYLKLGERFGFMEYGYLWYNPIADREVYAAIGDCGNIIYVNKKLNLAVGMTGTFKPRIFDRVEFIETTVIPAAIQ